MTDKGSPTAVMATVPKALGVRWSLPLLPLEARYAPCVAQHSTSGRKDHGRIHLAA